MSDTAVTPTAASIAANDEATLLRLPTELLLDILSELSYAELHKVEQVCKKLQGLVADKHFDPILFRQKPSRKLKKGDKVELHPLMDAVNIVFTDSKEASILVYEGDVDEFNAYDYKACDEFVTSPACTEMRVDLYISKDIRVTNTSGISNRQVLQAIAAFWSRKVPTWLLGDNDEEDLVWANTLGDRNGWQGWNYPTVYKDGVVEIATSGYDS